MSESNLNKDYRSDSNPVKNTRSDTNPNKKIKIIERELSKVLERERDFEESDFEIDEFDYFIKSEPYTNSIGTFDEDWIADEDIVKAKHILKESKEISSFAYKKLNLLLTQKFYGDNDCFPRQASYLLNQCLRAGTKAFEEAKEIVIQKGLHIVSNELLN